MSYIEQWKALSSRIRGLMQVGELHAHYLTVRSSDTYGRAKRLRDHSASILTALTTFRDRFQHVLPSEASDVIIRFLGEVTPFIRGDDNGTPDTRQEQVWAALVMLAGFETEMSFVLSDTQQHIRARSERAFAHLQRLIVVDQTTRAQWQAAFKEGEVACEKLGAVHLLLHGIWAFKISATGERTDLVFQETVSDLTAEERYADGLVLTEWKTAAPGDNAGQRFADARSQARRYAQGALAGNELTAYRYAIVVSSQHVPVPADTADGTVVYRHINVAVDPQSPSRSRGSRSHVE
jgi:hypothetical protein